MNYYYQDVSPTSDGIGGRERVQNNNASAKTADRKPTKTVDDDFAFDNNDDETADNDDFVSKRRIGQELELFARKIASMAVSSTCSVQPWTTSHRVTDTEYLICCSSSEGQ